MEIAYEDRVDVLQLWTRHSLEFIPHFHDSFEIVCMLNGNTDMMIGGEHFTLSAGDLAVAMPNTIHGYFRDNNVDAYLLIVPRRYAEAYAALLETHTVTTPVIRAAQQSSRLTGLIEEIIRTRRSASPYRREMICGYFTVLFGEIFSYTGMQESHKLPVRDAHEPQLFCKGLEFFQQLRLSLLHSGVRLADKAAPAGDGADIALCLQLPVGPLYGIGVYGKLGGKLPHRGHFIPRRQDAGENQLPEAVPYLFIDGPRVPEIDIDHLNTSVLTVLIMLVRLVYTAVPALSSLYFLSFF